MSKQVSVHPYMSDLPDMGVARKIEASNSKSRVHYVLVPKKDILDAGRIDEGDLPYLLDIFTTAGRLIEKDKLEAISKPSIGFKVTCLGVALGRRRKAEQRGQPEEYT